MKQPVGIIDSGVGGLSIASVLIKKLPNESIIYLADSKNCPYGEKSPLEIYNLSKQMIKYLLKKKAKLVLIACNTITTTCIDKLRKDFPDIPIVGIVPVIKTAVKESKNKKIGILSTKKTAESKYQKDLIKKFAKGYMVLNRGNSSLVPLIEKEKYKKIDIVLKKELEVLRHLGIDVLALGCSHFPLIEAKIKKLLPNVLILNSSNAVVRQVEEVLKNKKMLSNNKEPSYNFYTTGNISIFANFNSRVMNKKLTKKLVIEKIRSYE